MSCDMADKRLLDQFQVDAFTNKPFGGNSAAVVFGTRSEKWMQQLASENNLAETAFINPILNDDGCAPGLARYHLRWCVSTSFTR